MAKPALYNWASDAGATTDPGPARQLTGFRTGKLAPAEWFNFLFRHAYTWFQYVDNLHNEAEFLNQNYTFTGTLTLNGGTTLAENGFYAESGDLIAKSGTVKSYLGFQYCNSSGVATSATRRIMIPLGAGVPEGDATGWQRDTADGQSWISAGAIKKIYFDLTPFLRTGMVLVRVRCAVDMGGTATTTTMGMSVYKKTVSKAAIPLAPGILSVGSNVAANTDDAQIISTGSDALSVANGVPAVTIDLEWQEWQLLMISSDNPLGDKIMWIEIEVLDPGPRNY